MVEPQRYQTLPVSVIAQAEHQDRFLKQNELQELQTFFSSGNKRLEIAEKLTINSDEIIAAGANRIFVGGWAMDYLEKAKDPIGMPGSDYYVGEDYLTAARRDGVVLVKERLKLELPKINNPLKEWWERGKTILTDREPLPGGFHFINIARYGPTRMKRSMRDLSWFLRYISFAIVAGDTNILSVNARGLRGVIPEDVTEATVVALKEMQRQSLSYFSTDNEAIEIVKHCFEILISEYLAEKPSDEIRIGVSNAQQGLVLPQSYALASEARPKFVMKSVLSETEKQVVIKAAYRQVFERDITTTYAFAGSELESQVKSGLISMKEFIRYLGKSRLYRQLFYEPYNISRVIELAIRHFLGRGLSSMEEFQEYFAVITKGGFPKLVGVLVDSDEYDDYFGQETVPYLRGLGQEAQECRNWGPQMELFRFTASVHKVPQFVTRFGKYQNPLPNQHPYGLTHDPLEIQFGAIFPHQDGEYDISSQVPFTKDTRRILISCTSEDGVRFGQVPGFLGRVMKLDHIETLHRGAKNGNGTSKKATTGLNLGVLKNSPTAVIDAAYRQVFGRDVFENQRLTVAESALQSGEISMREFVRQLAKSKLFRHLFWEPLYVTKAIEYIHRRLLGRPTYGRQEMNHYYDICANKGFYALIDEIIDTNEYITAFGEDTVPHERYVTPRGYEMRLSRANYTPQVSQESQLPLDSYIPNGGINNHSLTNSKTSHDIQGESLFNESKPKAMVDTTMQLQQAETNFQTESNYINPA